MKLDDIKTFQQLQTQLDGFYEEITILSKKKPDDAINKFKLRFINQFLENATLLLGEDYCPFPDFTKFDLDDIPTNSDVVIMLSQYSQAFIRFRFDNTVRIGNYGYWILDDSDEKIQTFVPKKL